MTTQLTTKFLLHPLPHLHLLTLNPTHTAAATQNMTTGRRRDSRALKKAGEGVTQDKEEETKQSKDTSGVEGEPRRSAGRKRVEMLEGKEMFSVRIEVVICR